MDAVSPLAFLQLHPREEIYGKVVVTSREGPNLPPPGSTTLRKRVYLLLDHPRCVNTTCGKVIRIEFADQDDGSKIENFAEAIAIKADYYPDVEGLAELHAVRAVLTSQISPFIREDF